MKVLTVVVCFSGLCVPVGAVDWQLWHSLSADAVQLSSEGKFRGALPPARRAMEEARLAGSGEGRLADSLDTLGFLLFQCGEYGEAEKAFLEAIAVAKPLASHQTRVARATDHLASLYYEIGGRQREVESLRRQAVRIAESVFGPDSPEVGVLQSRLANSLLDRGRYKEAEVLLRRAMQLTDERYPGLVGDMYCSLGSLAYYRRKYTDALALLDRAGRLYQEAGGPDSPGLVLQRLSTATVYLKMGRATEADDALARAEEIAVKVYGPEHARVAAVLHLRAKSLRKLGRGKEADLAKERVKRIMAASAGDIQAVHSRVPASALAPVK